MKNSLTPTGRDKEGYFKCSRAWVNSSPEYTSFLSHENIVHGGLFLPTFIKEKYFRSVHGRSKPLKSMNPGDVYFNQINNSYNWCWSLINSLPVTQLRLKSLNLPSRRATSLPHQHQQPMQCINQCHKGHPFHISNFFLILKSPRGYTVDMLY